MSAKLYIHILWPDKLGPNDIQILTPATPDQPGQARLKQASTGSPRPEAPNSLPLCSRSGATVGFVANVKHLEPPYEETYVIT